MNKARVVGLGNHRPARLVTNHDIAARVETDDNWIRERTGITTRRIAGDGETVVEMAASAAAKALANSGVDPLDVDLVLLATCSLPNPLPGGAAEVASRLGSPRAGAADVNAACAGFAYALSWAADAVRAGSARNVVVAASERLSDWVDWDDRSTCILFGDGAGAAVVARTDDGSDGIGPVVWGSDGTQAPAIRMSDGFIRMDGSAVFRWATTALAPVAREACDRAGVAPSELAAFVPHQANARIVDALARALGVPAERVCRDVVEAGNTSAASIPMALASLDLPPGSPALLFGFGSGLTYAAQVISCP